MYTAPFGGTCWFKYATTEPVVYPQKVRFRPSVAAPGAPPTSGTYALKPQGCDPSVIATGAATTDASTAPDAANRSRPGVSRAAMRSLANAKPRPANRHRNGYAVIQCLVPPKIGVELDSQGA